MSEVIEKTNKQKILDLMEETLHKTIETEEASLKALSPLNQSKTKGIIAGAKEGLVALKNIRDGYPNKASSSLNGKINSSIYHLMSSEEKYKQNKSSTLENEIAYYDNLVTSLQLLKDRLSVFLDEEGQLNQK